MTEAARTKLANIREEEKGRSIPLMNKRLNSIEKYVQSFEISDKTEYEISKNDRNNSRLSLNAERMVYGGRFTPDPTRILPADNKCYVKYSPVKEEKTEEKLEILNKLSIQYSHLKNNLNGAREPFTSKFTVPLSKRKKAAGITPERERNSNSSFNMIEKQLKKETLMEDGKKHFLDLYMMKKDRAKLKEDIQKNHKFVLQEDIKDKHKEHEQFLVQKWQKEAEEKKNKMLVNKGLHWNVYYEMLALSNVEKERLRGGNSAFVATYGTE